jgi:hypothetical protein
MLPVKVASCASMKLAPPVVAVANGVLVAAIELGKQTASAAQQPTNASPARYFNALQLIRFSLRLTMQPVDAHRCP